MAANPVEMTSTLTRYVSFEERVSRVTWAKQYMDNINDQYCQLSNSNWRSQPKGRFKGKVYPLCLEDVVNQQCNNYDLEQLFEGLSYCSCCDRHNSNRPLSISSNETTPYKNTLPYQRMCTCECRAYLRCLRNVYFRRYRNSPQLRLK